MLKIQYDMFLSKEESELISLRREIVETKKSCDKVRKGLFARHNELAKQFLELKHDHDLLIKAICKGNYETVFRSPESKVREMAGDKPSGKTRTFERSSNQCLLAM